MDIVASLEQYLAWSRSASRELRARTTLPPKSTSTVAVLDLPLGDQAVQLLAGVSQAGYDALNIGLSPLWKNTVSLDTIRTIQSHIPIRSAHGTSIKAEIRNGTRYRDLLAKDLEVLETLDPDGTWLVNYDLYAGHVRASDFGDDFQTSLNTTLESLSAALSLTHTFSNTLRAVLERIVSDVSAVLGPSGRRVCFEVPGTKGWSLLPELTMVNLRIINEILQEHFPSASLCIDVGHILTWGRDKTSLQRTLQALAPYADIIRMLHISSAGSWQLQFQEAYRQGPGSAYPRWHHEALDLSLPVCEPEMLTLIQELRAMIPHELLEVSETRFPTTAIKDYFRDLDTSWVNDETYIQDLILQGELLGYRPI